MSSGAHNVVYVRQKKKANMKNTRPVCTGSNYKH